MNRRERTAIAFLLTTFLIGAGISSWRQHCRRISRQQIVVENPADTSRLAGEPLNLNSARKYELEALPGIGPKLAERILVYREQNRGFKSVDELRRISGIGPKRFAAIENMVTVGDYNPLDTFEKDSAPLSDTREFLDY